MFEVVIPYKEKKINLSDYPLRVIEVPKSEKKKQVQCYAAQFEEDEDVFEETFNNETVTGCNSYQNEDYEDDWVSPVTDDYSEDYQEIYQDNNADDYYQQFSTMDVNNTDWNSFDINRIIF